MPTEKVDDYFVGLKKYKATKNVFSTFLIDAKYLVI